MPIDPRELARAAESFVGVRFRLHGRDPATGLDCVGLLAASLSACDLPDPLPNGYALRTGSWPDIARIAAALAMAPGEPPLEPGDLCLTRPSPVQLHLAIAGTRPGSWVEAHAGLRRVAITPLPTPPRLAGLWRAIP